MTDNVTYTTETLDNDKRENARSVITIRPHYPEDNQAVYQCHARNNAIISGPLRAVVTLDVQCKFGHNFRGHKIDVQV